MSKKISIIILIGLLLSGFSYSAYDFSWKVYQVFETKYDSNKNTIINGLYNNNLNSSYYITKQNVNNGMEIERKDGSIYVFTVEKGYFNHLSGFNVTEYEGQNTPPIYWGNILIRPAVINDRFTAIYNNKDFSSKICTHFAKGNIIPIYISNGYIYTNIKSNDNTITKKIKIGRAPSNMRVYRKIKIIKGYTNCSDANYTNNGSLTNPPVQYSMIYYTKYQKDSIGPSISNKILVDENGNTININNNWLNKSVKFKVYCKDDPSSYPNKNSGCSNDYNGNSTNKWIYSNIIDTHLLNGETFSVTLKDNLGNIKQNSINVSIPIDKTKPNIEYNKVILTGKNDITSGYNYVFSTENNNINTILADEYKLEFIVKDNGVSCNNNLCRGISGIKSYNIKVNGNSRLGCSDTYQDYNPNKGLTGIDEKVIVCEVSLTKNQNYKIDISIEDNAGNIIKKELNFNVEPNKPINITKSCIPNYGQKYATNENDDKYICDFYLKDRWNNPIKKEIKGEIFLNANQYDYDNSNNNNAISILDSINTKMQGKYYIKYKSITPGKPNMKLIINKYNQTYTNISGNWEFNIDLPEFKKPINPKDIEILDLSGNIVPYTGMSANTIYTLKQCLSFSGFNEGKDYVIGDFNNGLKLYPDNIYKVEYINKENISNPNNGCYSFDFRFNIIGNLNKNILIKYNPSVTLNKDGKIGKYPLGEKTYGNDDKSRFRLSIIGFKYTYGNTNVIGQGKKDFNIESQTIKGEIRKNTYKIINSLENDKVYNGILIKNGDYKLDNRNYNKLLNKGVKVLIIRNGNIVISTNIDKRLDIAVVTDRINTDVTSNDYIKEGNIIITPNVTFINGLLYTDRSILNGKQDININNISYNDLITANSSNRNLLKNQLLFYGTIVSRNTIAGSIAGEDNKYTLPGGKKIDANNTNMNIASLYDIAFMRIGYNKFNEEPNIKYNNGKDDYIIIKYNPDIKLNPSVLLK